MDTAQLLAYWQQIFFETVYFNRVDCNPSKLIHLFVERNALTAGQLDVQSVRVWSDYWISRSTREVLVAPFCLSQLDETEECSDSQEEKLLLPLLCPAVLHADGTLTLRDAACHPWITPTLMDPMATHGVYLGARETYQRLLDAQPGQSDLDWLNFLGRSYQLLETLSKSDWLACLETKHYALHADALIIATDVLPRDHALFSLDCIQTDSAVLQRYCQLEEASFEPLRPNKLSHLEKHCGQLNAEILAPDAREVLAHLLMLQPGQLQSVATPLGSQYHATIGNLVASQLVHSALKCEALPLMVIVSDSPETWCRAWQISQDIAQCRPLTMRWLPEAPMHFGIGITQGQLQDWQYHLNITYVPKAKQFFMTQFASEFFEDTSDFKHIVQYLHQQLQTKYAEYLSGLEIAQAWLETHSQLEARYASQGGLDNTLQQLQHADQELEADYQQCYRAQKIWRDMLESRSLAKTVFDHLPVFQAKRQEKIENFLKKYCSDLTTPEMSITQDFESVTRFLTEKLRQIRVERAKQHTLLTKVCDDMASRSHWQRKWVDWQQQFFYQDQLPALPWLEKDKSDLCIQEETQWYLDQALRTELFWLAVHYWEATWLSESESYFKAYDQEYLPVKTAVDWQYYAMLGHAFIVPFAEIHSVFEQAFAEKTRVIDWLIVEETQRFLPMEVLSVLGKSNRVVALGDEYGMQPERAMTALQDVQALEKQALAHTDDEIDELSYRGFLASSGSFYQLAQDKSFFKTESPYGLLPTNTLKFYYDATHAAKLLLYAKTAIYKDVAKQISLQPIAGQVLPIFGYITLQYASQLRSGVLTNQDEAIAIAEWLANYYPTLEASDSIAILTPFAAQKACIEAQLSNQKLSRIPVLTFESLAHHFYDRIIFSPTYTSFDPKPLCFDQGAQWLHVAVQHALKSFWVFGDPAIFDPKTHSPSGYLGKLLFEQVDNHLPTRVSGRQDLESTLIERGSLAEYEQALHQCLNTATEQVVIASPKLNPHHPSVIQLEEMIAHLRSRQIDVSFYVGNQALLGWKDPEVEAILRRWLELGARVQIVHNCHTNQLILDDHIVIEGSRDWLNPCTNSAGEFLGERWCYRRYDRQAGRALIAQSLLELNRRVVRRLEINAVVEAI